MLLSQGRIHLIGLNPELSPRYAHRIGLFLVHFIIYARACVCLLQLFSLLKIHELLSYFMLIAHSTVIIKWLRR